MARQYQVGFVRKMINRMVAGRIRRGKLADNMYLLTTVGRKSGLERTTPVTLMIDGDDRYVVSPYGIVGWVHNVRAAGSAVLARGGTVEEVSMIELDAEASAPILKRYVRGVPVVRPFFDVDKNAPLEAFAAEASRHPVFKVDRK